MKSKGHTWLYFSSHFVMFFDRGAQ